jgi:hypothetical protein
MPACARVDESSAARLPVVPQVLAAHLIVRVLIQQSRRIGPILAAIVGIARATPPHMRRIFLAVAMISGHNIFRQALLSSRPVPGRPRLIAKHLPRIHRQSATGGQRRQIGSRLAALKERRHEDMETVFNPWDLGPLVPARMVHHYQL